MSSPASQSGLQHERSAIPVCALLRDARSWWARPSMAKIRSRETSSGADDLVNSMVIGHTYIINPTTINSFHLTGNRSAVTKTQIPSFDANTLGINMTTLVPGHIVATATGALYSSTVFSYAATDPVTAFQSGDDDFSMTRGSHQLQFGANWMHSAPERLRPTLSGTESSPSAEPLLICRWRISSSERLGIHAGWHPVCQ